MDLTLDDLIKKCEGCNGTGKRQPPNANQSGTSYAYTPIENSMLNVCDGCGGEGRAFELTSSGQAILDFFKLMKRRSVI
jgi:DnaJ-class molecular chaperone